MLNKMIKRILTICFFIITLCSVQVYADSAADNYNNYAYPMSFYKKPVTQPFSLETSGQSESINPSDGNLEIAQTDLYLKGKNGLDFAITRRYNLSEATTLEPYTFSNQLYTFAVGGYFITGTETKEKYINGSLVSTIYRTVSFCKSTTTGNVFEEMPSDWQLYRNSAYWGFSQEAQQVADNLNNGVYDTSNFYISGSDIVLEVTKYSDKKNFITNIRFILTDQGYAIVVPEAPYADSSNAMTASEIRFNLGTGWSFDIPYIERRGTMDNYLHLGNKGTFHFTYNYPALDPQLSPIPYMYNVDLDYSLAFDEYPLKDITISRLFNRTMTDVYYIVREKDGKEMHFNNNGSLIRIKDKFGNQISFSYTTSNNGYILISKIVDSAGRDIIFTYETNRIVVVVTDATNVANNRKIIYNKSSMAPGSYDYVLESVIDAENRITKYEYDIKDAKFSFRKKDPYSDNQIFVGNNSYACLKQITYPTGGITKYNFNDAKYSTKNLGNSGFMQFYKVTERADYSKDGKQYNYKIFKYNNYFNGDGKVEYDGYPYYYSSSLPADFEVKTEIKDIDNNSDVYTYKYLKNPSNNISSLLCASILKEGNNQKSETINDYNVYTKLLTSIINRSYDKVTGNKIEKIQNYAYDSNNYGDLTYYWDVQANGNTNNTENRTAYTYDSQYHYITSKTYKKDANTTVVEEYVSYPGDERLIQWYRVRENGVLKKQTEYLYDTYGNIIEEHQYKDDWKSYISTIYSYKDNVTARSNKFDGVYLTSMQVKDVMDADGILISAQSGMNAGEVTENFTYDWFGNVIQKTDGNGNVTTLLYDKLNRVIKQINPDGSFSTSEYVSNLTDNYTVEKDENFNSSQYSSSGNQTKLVFDDFGNLIKEQLWAKDASGNLGFINVKEYSYDNRFRLITNKNVASGALTEYSYFSDGRINTKKTTDTNNSNKLLYQENYTYTDADSSGSYSKVIKVVKGDESSPDIKTTTYINKIGKVEKVERNHQEGSTAKLYLDTFKYDYLGNKIEEKSARAYDENWAETSVFKYQYDFAGRVIKTYNLINSTVPSSAAYDSLGRLISSTDIKGNMASPVYSTTYKYDSLGRKIQESIPFENVNGTIYYTIKNFYYDRNGNIICDKITINKPGEVQSFSKTEYSYDNRDRLAKVTTFDNGQPVNYTQYFYDLAGNKLRMYTGLSTPLLITALDTVVPGADTEYFVTKYEYNQLYQLTKMTDPLGKSESYEYDLNGNLLKKIDRNGSIITSVYDAVNRVISRTTVTTNGTGNVTEAYTYNLTGGKTAATIGGATTSYKYDDLARLIKETQSDGITKEYTYDASDNRKTFVLKQNEVVKINTSYVYDKLNRLSQVFENGQLSATYGYDENSNRQSLIYSNGNSTEYQYNLANKLKTLTNKQGSTVLSKYTYDYYLDGNQEKKIEQDGKVTTYVYDGLRRLINEGESTGLIKTYTYDDSNNRKIMAVLGPSPYTVNYVYDKANRLITEMNSKDGTTSYSYDANGNQTAKGSSTYKYNGLNQLTEAKENNITAAYTYNSDGLRSSKTVNGIKTVHVWDGDQIALELNASGAVTNKYVRGINLIYAEDGTGANKKYYLFNGHGDVVQLTNTTGAVIKNYDYDAFGNEKNIDANDTNVFRYCGEYFDKETGTIYLRARYYNPAIGRFISEDSYWGKNNDPLSLNLYTYCYNTPVNLIDPDGHIPIVPIIAYLLQTGAETIPDIALDALLDGAKFNPVKSALVNYIMNLIPIADKVDTAEKLAKIGVKYGDNVIKYLASYGDEIAKYIKNYGTDGITDFIKRRGNEIAGIAYKTSTSTLKSIWKSYTGKNAIGEIHHGLPEEFSGWFAERGIDVNKAEYFFDLPTDIHRLTSGNGIHTNNSPLGEEWNRSWQNFIDDNPDATMNDILDNLNEMAQKAGISMYRAINK